MFSHRHKQLVDTRMFRSSDSPEAGSAIHVVPYHIDRGRAGISLAHGFFWFASLGIRDFAIDDRALGGDVPLTRVECVRGHAVYNMPS